MCDNGFDIDWEYLAMAGALSEEMLEEEKERLKLEWELEHDEGSD